MSNFSSLIIGNESLVIQCAEMLLDADHQVIGVVTRNPEVADWANEKNITVHAPGSDLAERLTPATFDWLLSVANLDLIPGKILDMAGKGAVNFHDGPLPRYAGLNAPVWALINGENSHGVSWHMISGGIDEGDIIAQSSFDVTPQDTALTLNTKCYGAAIDSFDTVITQLASDSPVLSAQDLSGRSYFGRDARPAAAARLDFTQPAETLATLVRALDHGDYWNPLNCPKIETNGQIRLVGKATPTSELSDAAPGTVLAADADSLTVATTSNNIHLSRIRDCYGRSVPANDDIKTGDILSSLSLADADQLTTRLAEITPKDGYWRARLAEMSPRDFAGIDGNAPMGKTRSVDVDIPAATEPRNIQTALAVLVARLNDSPVFDLALHIPTTAAGYISNWVPICPETAQDFATASDMLAEQISVAREKGSFACDLLARLPGAGAAPAPLVGLSTDPKTGLIDGTALTLRISDGGATLFSDGGKISQDSLGLMAARLTHILAQAAADPGQQLSALSIMPDAERQMILRDWNDTATKFDPNTCIHTFFEQQVTRTPDAPALSFEGEDLTYAQLNARANQVAHTLRKMGVKPGTIVGLHLPRSSDLLVGCLAILKAGGAYLPMDPTYPDDRTALFINDSNTPIIVTHADLAKSLPDSVKTLELDTNTDIASASDNNPDSGSTGQDLAYMIYTSGSTGKPKGVMVEHRNVSNFFTGMDARIPHKDGGVWLAVTSLSFDISVLELFWTLARGFKVVLSGDENRALVSGDSTATTSISSQGMEFSLFYWGNDDGIGRGKYRLLMEGAKFADQNGFCAVWTPERHFHAFGGPFPNPSVTGAAVAGLTENIGVRAGSCVAPLHHTARIAEEWAVIDNLTNGRAGLAIASGWQPDDFVLRPENTPPANKPAMFDAIHDLRKLWKGEAVEFPRKDGAMFPVITQPRPISKTLDIWVTTAGNPETWREAGTNGTHILTHLLGQSVNEVADKIVIYHDALRAAGHDPDDFKVTLMLHSFIAETREKAREISCKPMKDYLRAAAGLIKQYAWAFPAFKRPKGVSNPFEIDLASLNDEEMDGILEFAFERYFEDSGLFGTIEDCLARVEQLKRIGVTEIACLIDYGINTDLVLEGLNPLAQVLRRSNTETQLMDDDFSIATQIMRHGVSHMQCTPSMAQMLVMNDEARVALSRLDQLLIGGEALSGALANELAELTGAPIENMYGPTETTIWSTTQTATPTQGVVSIGRPVANTQTYVLDDNRQPVPVGVAGELYIAGAGVTRGYWQQPELTAERFVENPFSKDGSAKMYQTGDLVRWQGDGQLDFIGRSDHQVKLRGFRIELGEIESVLNACPGVHQSVVIAREDTPGLVQLVAYLTGEGSLKGASLKSQMADHLPGHMLPAHYVILDTLPLTPNKKIDRKALPAPVAQTSEQQSPAAASKLDGTVTQKIAAIWTSILGVSNIGPKDNFFDLGGHSLLAVQAHREIRNALNVQKLSITDIFRFPILGALAEKVEEKTEGGSKPAKSPETDTDNAQKVATRQDAMARRREMRARRQSSDA